MTNYETGSYNAVTGQNYAADGGGQYEGSPYAACYTYTTDKANQSAQKCAADEFAVYARAGRACTTAAYVLGCDMTSPTSCPNGTYKSSPYYAC